MATATATITIDAFPCGVDKTQRSQVVRGTIAIQASPATYATGGLALNWVGALQPVTNLPVETLSNPDQVNIESEGGNMYSWVSSTNTLKYFTALGTEETNGTAIPSGVSGDVIHFEAIFPYNR